MGMILAAGIGENSDIIRSKDLTGLEFMGIYWDPALNKFEGRKLS